MANKIGLQKSIFSKYVKILADYGLTEKLLDIHTANNTL